jgi:hypothetical protein
MCRVWGEQWEGEGLGLRVQGLRMRVFGSGFRAQPRTRIRQGVMQHEVTSPCSKPAPEEHLSGYALAQNL